MKEQAVIKQVPITRQGELRTFQVRLPKSAVRVIGIEAGIMKMKSGDLEFAAIASPEPKLPVPVVESPFYNSFFFRPELLIGELKLQSLEEANIFYAKDVYESDLNFLFGDFSALPGFFALAWTHGRKRYADEVVVKGDTTILQGIFKDRIGERMQKDFPYTVNVCVWYEIKDEKNDHQPCA